MLAVNLIQEVPNTDLSWILIALLGVFLLAIIIGAFASREKDRSATGPGYEADGSSEGTSKTTTRKKSRK